MSRRRSPTAKSARLRLAAKPKVRAGVAVLQVELPDRPGALAHLTVALGEGQVNIEDLQIVHSPEGWPGHRAPDGGSRRRDLGRPGARRGRVRSRQVGLRPAPCGFGSRRRDPSTARSRVPGDKSIAHRWLILAATAQGRSALVDLPPSLDVRSTASCLAALARKCRPALEAWASDDPPGRRGSRFHVEREGSGIGSERHLQSRVRAGRGSSSPIGPLDCGNSGTTMRLSSGIVAAAPFHSVLTGDASLRTRPMERVAAPLRAMGATIETTDGRAPLRCRWRPLRGGRYEASVPTAQVKSAVLLAGLDADGETTVVEPEPTRDHTERALRALGGPVVLEGSTITVSRFQHGGFDGSVPGDPSSAAFLDRGGSPHRLGGHDRGRGAQPHPPHFLDVMARMGVHTERRIERSEVGEPVGDLWVAPCPGLRPVRVAAARSPR